MKTMGILTSITVLLGITGCSGFKTLDVKDFQKEIQSGNIQVVDVRTPGEFDSGHLTGAINIDVKDEGFAGNAVSKLDRAVPVAVYCRSGKRSATAAKILVKENFKVVNLDGGILAWQEKGLPVFASGSPYEVDCFTTPSGKEVRFHALLHASIWIEYDGKDIFIDPVRKLRERAVDYSVLPEADYVFVTHEHGDHFDKELLDSMTASNKAPEIITNARCAGMLGYGKVMSNGDSMKLADDIEVDAFPAYNTTEGHTRFHPKGRDNGYILSLDGLRIYIAGDTEDIPEMESLSPESNGRIDIAFLPCNQPYTMTTDQLVNAIRILAPRVTFPYHYSDTDVESALPSLGDYDVRIRQYQ